MTSCESAPSVGVPSTVCTWFGLALTRTSLMRFKSDIGADAVSRQNADVSAVECGAVAAVGENALGVCRREQIGIEVIGVVAG